MKNGFTRYHIQHMPNEQPPEQQSARRRQPANNGRHCAGGAEVGGGLVVLPAPLPLLLLLLLLLFPSPPAARLFNFSIVTKRLGDPVPGLLTILFTASLRMASQTWAGVHRGLASKYKAATPATCGAATYVTTTKQKEQQQISCQHGPLMIHMAPIHIASSCLQSTGNLPIDVPDTVLAAVFEVAHADVMSVPGAKISTQEPKLEKVERLSCRSVDATVIAFLAAASAAKQAF